MFDKFYHGPFTFEKSALHLNPNYKEILKLDSMLTKANIPHTLDRLYDGWILRYPSNDIEMIMDAIEHFSSYGSRNDKLEIMGLLTPEEEECDEVLGDLTAEEVFERIKKHWNGETKGEGMIKIKEQSVDSEDICEAVLGKVFGEDHMFSLDEYDTLCTVIEQTLLHLKDGEKSEEPPLAPQYPIEQHIYYAHHQWKYGSLVEKYELDVIKRSYPFASIFNPSTDLKTGAADGETAVMAECLEMVRNSDILVFSSMDGCVGTGVYHEVKEAQKNGKTVFYIYQDRLLSDFTITLFDDFIRSDRLYAYVSADI